MLSGPVAFPKGKTFKTDSISAGVKVIVDRFDSTSYGYISGSSTSLSSIIV